ncbi:MAG: hypothetical protein AAF335_04685, partial [Bacteroidota bacterium]
DYQKKLKEKRDLDRVLQKGDISAALKIQTEEKLKKLEEFGIKRLDDFLHWCLKNKVIQRGMALDYKDEEYNRITFLESVSEKGLKEFKLDDIAKALDKDQKNSDFDKKYVSGGNNLKKRWDAFINTDSGETQRVLSLNLLSKDGSNAEEKKKQAEIIAGFLPEDGNKRKVWNVEKNKRPTNNDKTIIALNEYLYNTLERTYSYSSSLPEKKKQSFWHWCLDNGVIERGMKLKGNYAFIRFVKKINKEKSKTFSTQEIIDALIRDFTNDVITDELAWKNLIDDRNDLQEIRKAIRRDILFNYDKTKRKLLSFFKTSLLDRNDSNNKDLNDDMDEFLEQEETLPDDKNPFKEKRGHYGGELGQRLNYHQRKERHKKKKESSDDSSNGSSNTPSVPPVMTWGAVAIILSAGGWYLFKKFKLGKNPNAKEAPPKSIESEAV